MSLARIAGLAWLAVNAPGYRLFRAALADPRSEQEKILRRYLRANRDTAFGRAHGFDRITSPAEYRARVPLSAYADYEAAVDRIAAGDAGVLTHDPVRVLETTGGTTSRKRIPYTATLQRELRRAVAPWLIDLARRHPGLAAGRSYWSISPATPAADRTPGAVRSGFEDDAEYLGRFWRRLVESTLVVPSAVRHIPDIEAFRYVTALFLLRAADLTLISVWHPSFLTLLLASMEPHWGRLLDDVRDGRLRPPAALPPATHAALAARLRPMARRAVWLAAAGPTPGHRRLVWPRLRVVSCWGDGHAALHLEEVRRALPGLDVQPKGLLATEGCVTIPFEGTTPVAVRSHFFELLEDDGRPRLAHELDVGGTYSVVLTTGGGLYRYRLEDRVLCTGFVRATPALRFLGKERHVSDLVGEKLREDFVADVLRAVCARLDPAPRFALLAPDPPRPGGAGYTLYLEADHLPDGLAAALEAALRGQGDYAYAARLGQISPARVFHVRRGAAAVFLERSRAGGQRLGDVKAVALSPQAGWSERFEGGYAG